MMKIELIFPLKFQKKKKQFKMEEEQQHQPEQTQPQDSESKSFLQSPDSVLEPEVLEVIRTFITEGGTPHTAIQLLAESYKGLPQMCQLLMGWLGESGLSSSHVTQHIEDHFTTLLLQIFDPKKADSIFSEGAVSFIISLHSSRISHLFSAFSRMVGTIDSHQERPFFDLSFI